MMLVAGAQPALRPRSHPNQQLPHPMDNRTRKIIHVDMDAFYASVEQRDNPELRGQPVIVGGSPTSRGVVAACSYEARRFGIHSAMPSARAARLCPDAVFLKPRFDVYRRESTKLREIFARYTALIEPLSLDEAYLDVTDCALHQGSATRIAEAIRAAVRQEMQLTASAGVSSNKFLAKLASDLNKPDGIAILLPAQALDFIAGLPVRRFHGIGPATAARMERLGIRTGADLRARPEAELIEHFGQVGRHYFRIARGIDERQVSATRKRKSLGTERTFDKDVQDPARMSEIMTQLSATVAAGLDKHRLGARTLTIKVRYADFTTVTRSHSVRTPLQAAQEIARLSELLLSRTEAGQRAVRLLGVTASGLMARDQIDEPSAQYGLFG